MRISKTLLAAIIVAVDAATLTVYFTAPTSTIWFTETTSTILTTKTSVQTINGPPPGYTPPTPTTTTTSSGKSSSSTSKASSAASTKPASSSAAPKSSSSSTTTRPSSSNAATTTSPRSSTSTSSTSTTPKSSTSTKPTTTSTSKSSTSAKPTTTSSKSTTSSSSTVASSTNIDNSGPTEDIQFANDILQIHNYYRDLHQVGPLEWNNTLYEFAKNYANTAFDCSNLQLTHSNYPPYGENLAAGYVGGISPVQDGWYGSEIGLVPTWDPIDYTPSTGHLTQLLWRSSTQLGCARYNCSPPTNGGPNWRQITVCSYYPRGNVIGKNHTDDNTYFVDNVFPARS
ncbi:RBE1 Repressed by EFG1 protein 1 [Candida maltosa Xu316]|uniref:SCP domain-containing protein n=1 Tax=Candida maltosa (strain Xu316) TaxID=1245528 RepID=M3JCR6_CANMX|nr:hypothetical protein G210_5034 [Candida maltosa Xu316]